MGLIDASRMSTVLKDATFKSAKYLAARTIDMITIETIYSTAKKPDVILWMVPLYTVQYYEIARSQDKLKYRAVKGEFMAHQHGGNIGVRIDLILTGPQKNLTLSALQALHLFGDQTNSNTPVDGKNMFGLGLVTPKNKNLPKNVKNIQSGQELSQENSKPNTSVVDADDWSYQENKAHKTFTMRVQSEIMFDMYIETLVYSVSVKGGKDIIDVNILLRNYVPPPVPATVEWAQELQLHLTTVKGKGGNTLYKTGKKRKLKKIVTTKNVYPENFAQLDFSLNTARRGLMYAWELQYDNIRRQQGSNRRNNSLLALGGFGSEVVSVKQMVEFPIEAANYDISKLKNSDYETRKIEGIEVPVDVWKNGFKEHKFNYKRGHNHTLIYNPVFSYSLTPSNKRTINLRYNSGNNIINEFTSEKFKCYHRGSHNRTYYDIKNFQPSRRFVKIRIGKNTGWLYILIIKTNDGRIMCYNITWKQK